MLGTAFESSRRVQAGWTRESELKLRSDWKLSFLNDVKGLDPCMANSMDMVESNVDANYNIEDMTHETKAKAVRLYSLLTSYRRQRPLKLIHHVKNENDFEAWQTLPKDTQPATRARALALLSQVSRIHFAEGKSVPEQLPQIEALVLEYARISSQKYFDSNDAKVAAVCWWHALCRSANTYIYGSLTVRPTTS